MDDLHQVRGAIRAFLLGRVKEPALAEDLTQETLLRLTQRLHTLRNPSRLEAWVFQIARNVMADYFRSKEETEPFDETKHASAPEYPASEHRTDDEEALGAAVTAYVQTAVNGLPEPYRGALLAVEFEGVPQIELATRIGLSVSAAKSRVQR